MLRLLHIIPPKVPFQMNMRDFIFGPSSTTQSLRWFKSILYIIFHIVCINLLIRPRRISGISLTASCRVFVSLFPISLRWVANFVCLFVLLHSLFLSIVVFCDLCSLSICCSLFYCFFSTSNCHANRTHIII